MMRSVLLRTLYEKRGFTLGWTLGLAVLSVLLVVFFPSMRADGAMDALVASMPPTLEGFIGDIANLREFPTYLASQLFDIRSSIIVGIMAIILGLSLSVSDEEKGELRTTIALPLSRVSVLVQRWLAFAVIAAIVCLGFYIGIYAALPFISNTSIEFSTLFRLVSMTWLVILLLGTVPFAVGMATGKKSIAMLAGILLLAGSYTITVLGASVEWIEPIEPLTPLHYFPAVEIAKEGIKLLNVVVLASWSVIPLVVAVLFFRKRDIV